MKLFLSIVHVYLLLLFTLIFASSSVAFAITAEQRLLFDAGIGYSDPLLKSGSCNNQVSLIGSENAEKIWNYLIGKGLTAEQTAGIVGNIQSESAGTFDPRIVEIAYSDPPHRSDEVPPSVNEKGQPGFGIIQWTSPGRKQGLADLATQRGVIAGDLGLQLDYLWQELNNEYYKINVLDPILASVSYEEVSDIFLEKFEVPADIEGTRPVRRASALALLTKFGSGVTITTSVARTSACVESGSIALDSNNCPTAPVPVSQTVKVGTSTYVHPCIADEVKRLFELAANQGLDLGGGGYRDQQAQIETRKLNCGDSQEDIYEKPANSCSPPTARPGTSKHERGTAVDFTCDGAIFSSRSHECYIFLDENTSLKNLDSEPWHWSINGG